MLTGLLSEVLVKWEGLLPTLAYMADSGGTESSYFEDTLRKMRHPRSGELLTWQRVVDFYHAAERIWTMAEALFGRDRPRYFAWARQKLRILKRKTRGAKRVLHSAATFAAHRKMGKTRLEKFRKAYNYIRKRTKSMQYSEYKKCHIPLGSGITEAACKTVFTQRLKLSGMRWKKTGAQQILTLRTILLSNTWTATHTMALSTREASLPQPYAVGHLKHSRQAA